MTTSVIRFNVSLILVLFTILLSIGLPSPSHASFSPDCSHDCARFWGVVSLIHVAGDWRGVEIHDFVQGKKIFWHCYNAANLGCDQLVRGDYVVFEGPLQSIVGCNHDGPNTELRPSRVFRWVGGVWEYFHNGAWVKW